MFIHLGSYGIAQGQHWQATDSLTQYYIDEGRFDSALISAEKSLKLVKEKFGESDTLFANMLARMSLVQYYLGNYEEANNYLLTEKKIREEQKNDHSYNYCRLLNDIGLNFEILGKYDLADEYYTKSLNVTKAVLGENSPEYAMLCGNIAVYYIVTGKYQRAEQLFQKVIQIQKITLGEEHTDYALTLSNIGELYRLMGRYKESEFYLLESIRIYEQSAFRNNPDHFAPMNNLASLYTGLGNFSKAEKILLEIIDKHKIIHHENHPDVAIYLNNLAMVYIDLKYYTKAEQILIRVINIDKLHFGEKHESYATHLNNLGLVYDYMGNKEKAESCYFEASVIDKEIYGQLHPNYAMGLNNLSILYTKNKNYDEAIRLSIETLEIRETILGGKHPDYSKSLLQLGTLYSIIDKNDEAEPLILESNDITNYNTYQNFSFMSDEEKESYINTTYSEFCKFNSFALKRRNANPAIVCHVFNNSLRNKALLLKSNKTMRNNIINSHDSVLINQYEKWISLKKELGQLYSQLKDEWNKDVSQLEEQANALEKELVINSESINKFTEIQKLTWKDVRKRLKQNEAVVDMVRFQYYDDRKTDSVFYAALIITSDIDYPKMVLLSKSPDFEGKYLNEYSRYIMSAGFEDFGIVNQSSLTCYEVFWKEIENEIEGKEVIYFCPEGVYHKINLKTILCNDGKYVTEKKDIVLVNSVNEILENGYYNHKSSNLALLVGNPDFNLTFQTTQNQFNDLDLINSDGSFIPHYRDLQDFKLTNLPGSQMEVRQIEKILKQSHYMTQCLTGDQALETSVKAVENPRILHLATHGFFAGRINDVNESYADRDLLSGYNTEMLIKNRMLRSGLMFSGCQNALKGFNNISESIDDGILTSYEVMNLNLNSTELVVLSACESGLGEIINGEGVYGLQRAFKIAGAQNIIMSLWKVDDQATQLLMTKFYEYWLDGIPKRKAFNQAQEFLRTQTEYKSPFYWGGFVYLGTDTPTEEKSVNLYWLFLIIIPIAVLFFYRRLNKQRLIHTET
jgi:CHAT domain-containing protein/Flp pilus assembly protein TadD